MIQSLYSENEAQNGIFNVENGFQKGNQNGVQNGFQNEFAFPCYFNTWKLQGNSYGVRKKTLHEEMHECNIT